jgi:hypothetical protein
MFPPGRARLDPARDRIAGYRHHDRNIARRMPRRLDGWCERCDDHIDFEAYEFCGFLREKGVAAFGGAHFQKDVLTLD